MDSTVCAALAARDFDAYALHFSYGQRTEARELRSAGTISRMLGFQQFLPLRIDLFRQIGGSALTDRSVAVPDASTDEEGIGNAIPVTYVPFRNAHFLAAAVSWAEVLGARTVMIGAVEQDSSGYPDCRPAYYDAFNALIRQGTREGDIRITTPLIDLKKRDIVRLGVELGAPLHVSWSCYSGDEVACGVCESCVLRLRGFREAGLTDPIPYRGTSPAPAPSITVCFPFGPSLRRAHSLQFSLGVNKPMNPTNFLQTAALLLTSAALSPAAIFAQATGPGSIHGHVQNAAGVAQHSGEVRLTKDRSSAEKDRKYLYTFPVDANGDYKGDGVEPGTYVLFYLDNGKTVDFLDNIVVKPGDNLTVNDDMSREEFLKALSPEERKNVEEYKKKVAADLAANKTVGNLNAMLTSARDAEKAGKYDEAATTMTQATTQKPDEAILWLELGNAQLGAKKYDEAATAFQKAIDTNTASKKPNPSIAGGAYNNLGQALAKENKPKEANDAYEKAAQAEPAKAGMYFFNEAATLYNANSHPEAALAADKAIAADPARADAYYIKGQSLIEKSTVDPKSQKIIPPPGTLEAYDKYLELAPTGPHAAEIKQIVAAFDDKVTSTYRAGKKK